MLLMREAFAPLVLVSLSAVFSLIEIALTSTVLSQQYTYMVQCELMYCVQVLQQWVCVVLIDVVCFVDVVYLLISNSKATAATFVAAAIDQCIHCDAVLL